jgi:hypothetical protein
MVMHLAIGVVIYNLLVHLAPVRDARRALHNTGTGPYLEAGAK